MFMYGTVYTETHEQDYEGRATGRATTGAVPLHRMHAPGSVYLCTGAKFVEPWGTLQWQAPRYLHSAALARELYLTP